MTPLRQRMTEDMQVRNLSPHTRSTYLLQVSLFARHFHQSPEALGPEEIRSYQVYLTNEKKLAPSSILIAVSALRFLLQSHAAQGLDLARHHPGTQETAEITRRSQPGGSPTVSRLRAQPQAPRHPA